MQALTTTTLDREYQAAYQELCDRLKQADIGVQQAMDGWKKRHVSSGDKLLNYCINWASSASAFQAIQNVAVAGSLTGETIAELIEPHLIKLDEMLGGMEKVLGVISDGEAAVRKALNSAGKIPMPSEHGLPGKLLTSRAVMSCKSSADLRVMLVLTLP